MKAPSRAKRCAARLKQMKKIWAQLGSRGKLTRGGSSGGQAGFSAEEKIAEDLRFSSRIGATEIDGTLAAIGGHFGVPFGADIAGLGIDDVSIRVHGAFHDARVMELWRSVEDYDVGDMSFLDFDVHAAHSVLQGQPLTPWPHVSIDAPDDEIAHVLQLHRDMLDRLWDHAGGRDPAGFKRLALWVMEKDREVGAHANAFGVAFAAFLYGDRGLARKILAAYEAGWDQRLRAEPDRPVVAEVRARALAVAACARDIIG